MGLLRPNQQVVDILESQLALAQAGQLRAVIVIGQHVDQSCVGAMSWDFDDADEFSDVLASFYASIVEDDDEADESSNGGRD